MESHVATAHGRTVGIGIGALAGLLLAASVPPWSWWPAGPVGLLVLVVGLSGQRWPRRALIGATAGVVWFGITLRWVAAFTLPGAVLLVVVEAGFLALAAVATPRGRGRLLTFPGAVVIMEVLRYRWPLAGLPLSGPALGQVDGPIASVAPLAGPHGMLLMATVLASVLAWTASAPSLRRVGGTGLVAAVTLGVVAAIPTAIGTRPAADPVTVVGVQGGGQRGVPAVRADPQVVLRRHLEVAAGIEPGADLVVWPEDVVDVDGRFAGSGQFEAIARLSAAVDAPVVVGVVEDAATMDAQGPRRFRNAAIVVGADGTIIDRYDKVLRVPFGEYVPWRSLVERIADLSLIPRDAVRGTGPGLLSTPVGELGVMISFEGMFPRRARDAVRAGGGVLVLPTNASSYVTDDVPAQELAAARLRALETGRDLVMVAPTGYSATVAADGVVLDRSELGATALVRAALTPRSGLTPYTRTGDGPAVVAAALLVVVGWWRATFPRSALTPRRHTHRSRSAART